MSDTVNPMLSGFFTASNRDLGLNFMDHVDRVLNLMKSQFPQLQYNGVYSLNELTFQKFKFMVNVFSNYRSMEPLFRLLKTKDKKTKDTTMSLLWNFSAEESLKIKMFDEGLIEGLMEVIDEPDYQDQILSSSAIIQNLSEYRFETGVINPNQLKIAKSKKLLRVLHERSKSLEKKIKFLSCLTLCNLSMNDQVRVILNENNYMDTIQEFVMDNIQSSPEFPSSFNWVTLQPHVPLLTSKDYHVQMFVLYCVNSFTLSERYNKENLWKTLGENNGTEILLKLQQSDQPLVQDLAKRICERLNIGKSSIVVLDTEQELTSNIGCLFNNKELFSDFILKFKNNDYIYLHKSICLSRCSNLSILLEKETVKTETDSQGRHIEYIEIKDEELYQVMIELFKYLYGIEPTLTESASKRLLVLSDILKLNQLKEMCEFFLWHYIDVNNAGELLELSTKSNSTQLKQVVMQFILRNISVIYNGNLSYYYYQYYKEEFKKSIEKPIQNIDQPSSSSSPVIQPSNNNNINNQNNNNLNNTNIENGKEERKEILNNLWKGEWTMESKLMVAREYHALYKKQKKEIQQLNIDAAVR